MKDSDALLFLALCKQERIPPPEREYKFLKDRKFRMDFAWLEHKLFLEVEGGVWIGGGHTHPTGFVKNMEKYNLAATHGWRLLRVEPKHLCKTATIEMVRNALNFVD